MDWCLRRKRRERNTYTKRKRGSENDLCDTNLTFLFYVANKVPLKSVPVNLITHKILHSSVAPIRMNTTSATKERSQYFCANAVCASK